MWMSKEKCEFLNRHIANLLKEERNFVVQLFFWFFCELQGGTDVDKYLDFATASKLNTAVGY